MPEELVKVICRTVVALREGDRVKTEVMGPEIACYGPDELLGLWAQAEAEVANHNAAPTPPPNRAERRRAKPPRK